ncbi:MAG: hypothetical protein P1V35_00540 [Planctomycetota bacterium]|nr:hypothetical protein [Planctomycetota bacterium]
MQPIRFLLALALTLTTAFALQGVEGNEPQTAPPAMEPAPPPIPRGSSLETRSLATLAALRDSKAAKIAELDALQSGPLRTGDSAADRLARIQTLQSEIKKLQYDFDSVATGIDVRAFDLGVEAKFDLLGEVESLLKPIVSELRSATEAPREMERLRGALEYAAEHKVLAVTAVNQLDDLIAIAKAANEGPLLGDALEQSRDEWQARVRELENQRTVASFQLEQHEARKRSVIDSMQGMFGEFFRTRGINLLLAAFTFLGVLLVLRAAYRLVNKRMRKHSRGERKFYARLIDVLYFALTGMAAVAGALLVLYSAGDWAMLGLAILILLGLGWASKTAVPMFFEQIRLLLNLGAVREGERVLYQGLVWRVTRLSINTLFVNPKLAGGVRRVPLRDMIELRSRASAPHEPWFPTSRNDWILIDGNRLGQITFQSPEIVHVQLLGGSLVHYPTIDFLGVAIENLSTGFRINQRFGIDYSHQATCTDEIPAKMQAHLERGLHKQFDRECIADLRVEFIEASASSLDYAILADFHAPAGPHYQQIDRAIQRLLVDACNQEGWEIPFTQITLHQAASA